MYKLIACDVDGTLLMRGEDKIDPEVFVRINNLCNMGVTFVVASGRPYYQLAELFAPVASLLTFVCCDGAVVVRGGRVLFEMPFSIESASRIVSCSEGLLYGLSGVYKDIVSVCGNIYKICLKKKAVPADVIPADVYIGYTGDGLTELLPVGADKGVALTFLQKKLRIPPEESIAFGDNRNDLWMLRSVGRGYAMRSAKCDLSSAAEYVTDNVIRTIDELFFNKRACL